MTRLPPFVWGLAVSILATVSTSTVTVAASSALATAPQQVIVFADGTEMEIQGYEVKGGVVQFTTADGRLRSVPGSYVNLAATEARNRGSAASPGSPPPTAPSIPDADPPSEMPLATETIRPEPEPILPPTGPEPETEPAPTPAATAAAPPAEWASEELAVGLVVPSGDWRVRDVPPSFDVAVTLDNPSTEAQATLALVRRPLRGRSAFRELVQDIGSSVALGTGYRALGEGELTLERYETYEFRFAKRTGFVDHYNRLVVYYSRDLAYVLRLSCPEARLEDNASDFEALVRGLVIRKSRRDLSF